MDREPETDRQGDDPYTHAHPDTLNLSAAARAVIEEERYQGQGTALEGAVAVWEALTGLTGADAREYAEAICTDAVTATIIPF